MYRHATAAVFPARLCFLRFFAGRFHRKKGDHPLRDGPPLRIRSQDLDLVGLLIRQLFGLRLGQAQFQNAVLEAGLHILGLDLVTHIEAAGAGTGIPFLTDVMAVAVLLVPVVMVR